MGALVGRSVVDRARIPDNFIHFCLHIPTRISLARDTLRFSTFNTRP